MDSKFGPQSEQCAINNSWPSGVARIPTEEWANSRVDDAAIRYDKHAKNVFGTTWEPTISQVLSALDESNVLLDYSCGTGQFSERLLSLVDRPIKILNVDVSPRYLRIAADRFKHDGRVALRLLRKLNSESEFEPLENAVTDLLPDTGADLLVSTNAIHLYSNLSRTLDSWRKVLRKNARIFISTGDINNPKRKIEDLRLHNTVTTVNEIAENVVRTEPVFEEYRDRLDNRTLMRDYLNLREHVYPPARTIDFYLDSLAQSGIRPIHYFEEPVNITVDDLVDALLPYHDVVLGWIGGSRKVEKTAPSSKAIQDRLFLIKYCADKILGSQNFFQCAWTYITCRNT